MINTLLVIQIILTILLILLVFLQKGDSDSASNLFAGRSGGVNSNSKVDSLVKFTGFIGALFMINSLCIAKVIHYSHYDAGRIIQNDEIIAEEKIVDSAGADEVGGKGKLQSGGGKKVLNDKK